MCWSDTSVGLALAQREKPFHRAARARLLPCRRGIAGLTGGAFYDGLVGAAARKHNLPLISCDRRAEPTYRALGVNYELLAVMPRG